MWLVENVKTNLPWTHNNSFTNEIMRFANPLFSITVLMRKTELFTKEAIKSGNRTRVLYSCGWRGPGNIQHESPIRSKSDFIKVVLIPGMFLQSQPFLFKTMPSDYSFSWTALASAKEIFATFLDIWWKGFWLSAVYTQKNLLVSKMLLDLNLTICLFHEIYIPLSPTNGLRMGHKITLKNNKTTNTVPINDQTQLIYVWWQKDPPCRSQHTEGHIILLQINIAAFWNKSPWHRVVYWKLYYS